jgi:hypothetical protein
MGRGFSRSAKSDSITISTECLFRIKPFLAQFGQKLSEEDLCDILRSLRRPSDDHLRQFWGLYNSNVYASLLNSTLESLLHILHLNIFRPAISRNCQIINIRARSPLTSRNKSRTVAEEFIHVFEIEPLGFRLETPEENGVGEVAYNEYDVEFLDVQRQFTDFTKQKTTHPADGRYGDRSYLSDHRVEGERSHCTP